MSGLVQWTPQQRAGSIARFDARYWTVDFGILPPAAASIVSDGPNRLTVHAICREDRDFVGLIWESEDTWSHPLHRYEAQPSYRNVTLRFRWIGSPGSKALSAGDGPVLTVEGHSGRAWFIRLWNHRVLPNPNADDEDPRDQVIEITFDEDLYAGFTPPDPLDPDADPEAVAAQHVGIDEVARMFLSIVPVDYVDDVEHVSAPLPSGPASFSVTLEEIECTAAGTGGVTSLARRQGSQPVHALRMTDGYDNAYHLAPERVVQQALQLGYRDWWVLYMGISHFHMLSWSPGGGEGGADAWLVDDQLAPLNPPTEAWLADFCARLEAAGFGLWLSVSLEVLAEFMPPAWAQRDHAGVVARTGWSPPSSLVSPASVAGMAWLGGVAAACLDIAVDAGLAPRFQIGEPWWWDGSFDGPRPHIYDAATEAAYVAESGNPVPTPRLDGIAGPPGVHEPYLVFCRDLLAAATDSLIAAAQAEHPGVETALLLFTPQVFRPDSEILTLLNFPGAAWAWPAFDVLQIEDYDWVFEAHFDLWPKTWEVALDVLGYPLAAIHYFGGFVLQGSTAYQWRWIDRAIAEAFARGPAEVFVWSREQVMRDGWTVAAEPDWPSDPAPRLTTYATCWRVERRDGLVQGFTSHDRALTIDGLAYLPAVAFDPTEIAARASLGAGGLEVVGGFSAEEIAEADLRDGLYDGAAVEVFQVDWSDLAAPRLLLARGTLGEVSAEAGQFRAELRGTAARLAQPAGEVYQPHCRADLGDARCGVDIEALRVETTVTATGGAGPFDPGDPQILGVAAEVADGAYDFGLLRFESGANEGLAIEIRRSEGDRLHLFERPLHSVALGTAVHLLPGCDKTAETCRARYDNLVNFRGEPWLPGAEAVMRPVRRRG